MASGPSPARIHLDDVKRVAGFRGADFGGIHRVVAELFLGELMFRVADLAIGSHAVRIELDLHLHVRRRDVQRAGELRRRIPSPLPPAC